MKASTLPKDAILDVASKIVERLSDELDGVRVRLDEQLRAELDGLRVPQPEPEVRTPAPLARACAGIREGKGQVAVLRSLLAGASSLGARAALFVLRSDHAELWDSSGFEDDQARAGSFEGTHIDREDDALRAVIVDRRAVYIRNGSPHRVPEFGQAPRSEVSMIPIRVQERVVAVLYCDRADEESPLDRGGLEVLGEVAGLAVERLALARVFSPSIAGRASGPVPTMHASERAAASIGSSVASIPSGPVGLTSTPTRVPVEEDSDPGFDLMPEPEEPATLASTPETEDARRFARLLVEEICLYHPEQVDAGRSKRDLGERLADEIDRARKMYEQRVSASVRSKGDFFGEALVKVLAAGDAAALS